VTTTRERSGLGQTLDSWRKRPSALPAAQREWAAQVVPKARALFEALPALERSPQVTQMMDVLARENRERGFGDASRALARIVTPTSGRPIITTLQLTATGFRLDVGVDTHAKFERRAITQPSSLKGFEVDQVQFSLDRVEDEMRRGLTDFHFVEQPYQFETQQMAGLTAWGKVHHRGLDATIAGATDLKQHCEWAVSDRRPGPIDEAFVRDLARLKELPIPIEPGALDELEKLVAEYGPARASPNGAGLDAMVEAGGTSSAAASWLSGTPGQRRLRGKADVVPVSVEAPPTDR
jgi:hypothetical protein